MPVPPNSLGRLLTLSTSATSRMCNAMLASHDLQLAQWVILSALWRQDGLLVSELARYSGHNQPATSRIIGRMERKGLLSRRADETDRRAVRVDLTDKSKALSHLIDFYRDVNAVLLAGFSTAEADTLFGMLRRVTDNANASLARSQT